MLFLSILKIVGIVLLCLLGFFVLVAALVLFVPVRFYADMENHDHMSARAGGSFLLFVIRFRAEYEKDRPKIVFRIFGIPVFDSSKKKKKKKDATDKNENTDNDIDRNENIDNDIDSNIDNNEDENNDNKEKSPEGTNDREAVIRTEDLGEDMPQKEKEPPEASEKKAERKKRDKKKNKHREKNKGKNKEKNKKKNKKGVIFGLESDELKEVISFLLGQVKDLLSRIHFKKLKGNASFSLQSPDSTGLLVGFMSLLPFMYSKKLFLYPDFTSDRMYFDGEISMKGHLRLIGILVIAIRVIRNKTIKKALRNL